MEFKMAPEGVVAATAARSPGGSKVERTSPAVPAAPLTARANLLGHIFPTLKNLAMNVEDDFVEMEASGRGRRLQKLREIFGETVASGGSKRPWAAVEEDSPTTAVSRPSKRRAMTRDIPVIPDATVSPASSSLLTKRATPAASYLTSSSAAASQTPVGGKRKRADDDDEAATTALPPAKKRARNRATFTAPPMSTKEREPGCSPSTAPLITAAWEASRPAYVAPSVPLSPPVTDTCSPSVVASAASPASTSSKGAPTNADLMAPISAVASRTTSVVTVVLDPDIAPLFFMPGFSTPLFSVAAPPTPPPEPAPMRTLLPPPVWTVPVPRDSD